MDGDAIKRLASKVSPEALARVSGRQWNPAAKSALVTSGAQVSAKWLNHFGISAENAPEIALALAMASIGFGSLMLRRELRAMALEKVKSEKRKAESGKESGDADSTL